MRLLYITQTYPPDICSSAYRAKEISDYLANSHKVDILTGFPHTHLENIPEKYKKRLWVIEKEGNKRIIRTFMPPLHKHTALNRVCSNLSFNISSVLSQLILKGRYDIVYSTYPQLLDGISGCIISRIKKTKFVVEIRDTWVNNAIELNKLRNPLLQKIARWAELYAPKKADKVVCLTNGIKNNFVGKGIEKEKIKVISNGFLKKTVPKDRHSIRKQIRKRLNLEDKFIVLYAGIHGIAQDLENVLRAADLLKKDSEIRFILMGDGTEKKSLINMKERLKLSNVLFLKPVQKEEATKYIVSSDLCLITLKRTKSFKTTIPHKVFDYLGFGAPVISTVDGEARKLLERSKGGIFCGPERPGELANSIKGMYKDHLFLRKCSLNGRKYILKHFDRGELSKKLEKILSRVCGS